MAERGWRDPLIADVIIAAYFKPQAFVQADDFETDTVFIEFSKVEAEALASEIPGEDLVRAKSKLYDALEA